ncbi:hypothetical protein FJY94_09435 [Candidatus Kaiserbacteria bacterium]|nr:hypothetical protein [Candidatus Kaiserbacteria bacterium]
MTEADAIDIAAKHAEQQGWPWLEPVECIRRKRWFSNAVYVIRTNADKRGANVVLTVDAVDGEVREAQFLKR